MLLMTLGLLGAGLVRDCPTKQSPNELVLALDDDERKDCRGHRFQSRRIRSLQGGEFLVTYETARTATGVVRPAELEAVVPKGSSFAYDVIAEVMTLRHVELLQRKEICANLAARKVDISTGSVSKLSWLGLAGLEQLHELAAPKLAQRYRKNAFILQLDGTREGGEWSHFVIREGFTGNVLLAGKIRSEHHVDIATMLRRVKELFGIPDAIISDMSQAIALALKEVFDGVPHRICHFHFLRDVGKALLGVEHEALGHSVRQIRKDLGKLRRECVAKVRAGDTDHQWLVNIIDRVNAHSCELKGEGFPFDMPHLAYHHNCQKALPEVEAILHTMAAEAGSPLRKHMVTLCTILRHRETSGVLNRGVARFEKLAALFQRLRDILHPIRRDNHAPLNWGRIDDPQILPDMAGAIAALRSEAKRMSARQSLCPGDRKAWNTLHTHLDKYAEKLNPIVKIRDRIFFLPRTNNLSETRFRDIKRRQRRTTGNGDLSRQIDDMPAQVFYVENLHDEHYRTVVLDGRPLHEALARTNWDAVRKKVKTMAAPRCPGAIDHELINKPDFFKDAAAALCTPLPIAKSAIIPLIPQIDRPQSRVARTRRSPTAANVSSLGAAPVTCPGHEVARILRP